MAKDFSAIAAAPADASQPEADVLPLKRGTPNFWIAVHPNNPECVETDRGWEWLPRLKVFYERAGVNGVREVASSDGKRKTVNSDLTRTQMQRQGWVLIPRDFCPDEVMDCDSPRLPGKGYVVAYKGANGWVHLPRWDKPTGVTGGNLNTRTDNAQKWAFQRAVMAAKFLEPFAAEVIDQQRDVRRRRLDRNIAFAHLPKFAHNAALAKAELEGMERAAQRQDLGETLTMASVKAEIMLRLDALGIEYSPSEPKKDLLAKLEAAAKKPAPSKGEGAGVPA